MMVGSVVGSVVSASTILGMWGVCGGLSIVCMVGSVSGGDWGLWGIVTSGARTASGDVSDLVMCLVGTGRAVRACGALSSGTWCLVVSLIGRGFLACLLGRVDFVFGLVYSELLDSTYCLGVVAVVLGVEVKFLVRVFSFVALDGV